MEKEEIREFITHNNWDEIAKTYNISIDTIEKIAEPPHRILDNESLSFLFEILREQPLASAIKLCREASIVGLTISESAVNSFRNLLKLWRII